MNKLKEYRKKQNLTQTEIAKKLNIQKQTYQNYELGKREPSIDMLIKLADLFHTSVDNLIRVNKDEINKKPNSIYDDILIEKIKRLNKNNLLMVEGYVDSKIEEQEKENK